MTDLVVGEGTEGIRSKVVAGGGDFVAGEGPVQMN